MNVLSFGDRIYDLYWYELPLDERVFVQLMIQRAQKPFELKGLGIFVCSLETFLKVFMLFVENRGVFRHRIFGKKLLRFIRRLNQCLC